MSREAILGWVLAGGRSRRMGVDKADVELAGRPLVRWVVARLSPQCERTVLGGPPTSRSLCASGLPVVGDPQHAGEGPLVGLLAALRTAAEADPPLEFVVTVPVDVPFLPADLVRRLHDAAIGADVAFAASGGRVHHVVALWRTDLRGDLESALAAGVRRVEAFGERHRTSVVTWPTTPFDPFLNVNTAADLERAAEIAERA